MLKYENLFFKVGANYVRLSLNEHGHPRRFILINTPESKRYAGFIMMNRDLDLVIEAISNLADRKQPAIIQQSMLFFAIVTYAKCFTSNNGARPSLNSSDIFGDNQKLLNEHKRIMNLRNDYVAHAGAEFDQCLITGTLVESGQVIVGIDINSQLTHAINMPPKLSDFQKLCEFLKDKIKIKLDKSFNKVIEYTSNLDYHEIKSLISKPSSLDVYKIVQTENPSPTNSFEFKFKKV